MMVQPFLLLLFAVGVFLFSFLCVLGSSLFALGSHFKGSPYLLPLMLTGRLLFGSGNGSLTSKFSSWIWTNILCSIAFEEHFLTTQLPFSFFISCSESHHSLLVQREGVGFGFQPDRGPLAAGLGVELLPHAEVWRKIWHAVDTLGW